jgi:hypothetical protein
MSGHDTRFALLQRSLEIPEVARLKRAFRSLPGLTESDAHTLANDAFGILVKDLSPTDAITLQGALQSEGVETAVVLQSDLPQLPPIKFVQQMDCLPEALIVHDPIGRQFPVPWNQVMLVAAGSVRLTVFEQQKLAPARSPFQAEAAGWAPFHPGLRGAIQPAPEYVTRERLASKLLLELLLAGAVMQFQIEAERFRYHYLGERKRPELADNFALLVQDVMTFAPQAAVNRGAYFLREKAGAVFEYPSKNAFYEEMTWTLWQMTNAPSPPGV